MPIEIRELIIRVTVTEAASTATGQLSAALASEAWQHAQQELTRRCVRQVLAELDRQRER